MDVSHFKQLPIMGILRGVAVDIIEELTECVISAGLKTIEITMNTPAAPKLLDKLKSASKGVLNIGAGTVLDIEDLKKALDSGAEFVVSPVFLPEIVEYCRNKSIPVFPGALTPHEIYDAWSAGASMVKVFPAKFFGPTYFKEIKGPFADIELLACGGVNSKNIGEFFACGASAVAFGGSIFKKEWLDAREFTLIGEQIKKLVEQIHLPKLAK